MSMPTYNGWLTWSFNDEPFGLRKSKDDVYKFNIDTSTITEPVKSYKEELYMFLKYFFLV